MGTWIIPNTNKSVSEMQALLATPLPAKIAEDAVWDVFGDDNLLDNIVKVKKIDPDADVRCIITHSINQRFLSDFDPSSMASDEVIDALSDMIDSIDIPDDDVFSRIKVFSDIDDALSHAKHQLDVPQEDLEWEIALSPKNFNYLIKSPKGDIYRLDNLSAVVYAVHPSLTDRYAGSFDHTSGQASKP